METVLNLEEEITQIEKQIKRINAFCDYSKRITSKEDLPKRAYLHEIKGVTSTIKQTIEEYRKGFFNEEEITELLPSINAQIKKENLLERITGLKNFSKQEIISPFPTSLNELARKEISSRDIYLKDSQVYFSLKGDSKVYLKPEAMLTFLSTNIGNSVKWAPNKTGIYLQIKDQNPQVKINLENEFGEVPLRDIGEGEKIGTEISKKILQGLNGKCEKYSIPRISQTNSPIYGIEYSFEKF